MAACSLDAACSAFAVQSNVKQVKEIIYLSPAGAPNVQKCLPISLSKVQSMNLNILIRNAGARYSSFNY